MDHDNITKPKHYQFSKPCNEVRDVIKDRLIKALSSNIRLDSHIEDILYDYSSAIKYLLRWFEKNGAEDLRKAQYCISEMLCILENGKDSTNKPTQCKPSDDVPVVDLDKIRDEIWNNVQKGIAERTEEFNKLWEQECNKVHPYFKAQYAEALDKCCHIPIARFPPWD